MTDRPEARDLGRLTDLLADLDADLLTPDESARVRASLAGNPRAAAVRAALDATRSELAALPAPPLPPEVTARWDAALAAEAQAAGHAPPGPAAAGPAPPVPLRPRSSGAGRNHRRPAVLAVLAGAVVAAAAVGVALLARPQPPSLDRVDLAAAGRAALGTTDVGTLADPTVRAGCLRAVAPPGVAPDSPLLGGRRVELGGRPAVLMVLGTGELGRFHVIAVDPGCAPEPVGGTLLGAEVIGR